MKRFLLVLLLIAAPTLRGADNPSVTFYVQLVCGSDADAPPSPQARLLHSHLDQRLHNVFRWKNYWEIKRETVALKSGGTARCRMTAQRDIEIAWSAPREMTISIYNDGKLTRKRQQSVDAKFYIAGGDTNDAGSWFFIVRRDDPDAESPAAGTKLAFDF